jgi:hypothetical protein
MAFFIGTDRNAKVSLSEAKLAMTVDFVSNLQR